MPSGGLRTIEQIRAYLVSVGGAESLAGLSDTDSLLEAGVIDSVSMIELITYLERTYGISAAEDDLIPENFASLEAIVRYLERGSAERA